MEPNDESVRWGGTPATSEAGKIFWGELDTND